METQQEKSSVEANISGLVHFLNMSRSEKRKIYERRTIESDDSSIISQASIHGVLDSDHNNLYRNAMHHQHHRHRLSLVRPHH